MRIYRFITIAVLLVAAQFSAYAGEIAVLKNGFSIHFERKEQTGNLIRLYTGSGYMEIASDQIESYEAEEVSPVPDTPEPGKIESVKAQTSTTQPVPAVQLPAARTVAAAPKALEPVDIEAVVREAATRNRIDPDFVASVIKQESNFKTHAVSRKGAQGLMQLMPGTAAQLGVTNAFDAKANVEAGTAYLSSLLDLYHDDPIKALAAYNAGAFRVKQYNGVPPYRETRAYIARIVHDYNSKKLAQKKAVAAAAKTQSTGAKVTGTPAKAANPGSRKKASPQEASVTKSTNPA
jgi:soluble lytic murein transglycosylase-like protein